MSLLVIAAVLASRAAAAQTYTETVLYSFPSGAPTEAGNGPAQNLIQASDGRFYGTSSQGGPSAPNPSIAYGTVFSIDADGSLNLIHGFCDSRPNGICLDGQDPNAIIQGPDGNFYGTTSLGGIENGGELYSLAPTGLDTDLYDFCPVGCDQLPSAPLGGLILGNDGAYYGTTFLGGSPTSSGTVFKFTAAEGVALLYSFCIVQGCPDGTEPRGSLLQGSDGNFYGVTQQGGTGYGTIFRLTPSGSLTTVHSFCAQGAPTCADGFYPRAGLVEDASGNLYGTTSSGGIGSGGIVYKISSAGVLTVIASFGTCEGCSSSAEPQAQLFLASDGNIYGTTTGISDDGSVFSISPTGAVTSVYTFPCAQFPCEVGANPVGGLVQGNDGNLYGTTFNGGASNFGAIFELTVSPPLKAPVQVSLSSSEGSVGNAVTLSWEVVNAFSLTMQQCFASVLNGSAGAGSWTGLQAGKLANGVYAGQATITPTANGVYTYALTCGGVESGFANLQVGGAKAPTTLLLEVPDETALGDEVTLTAIVDLAQNIGPPTGSVEFSSGETLLGNAAVSNGAASLVMNVPLIPQAGYPVTAVYSGDEDYNGSSATAMVAVFGYLDTLDFSANPMTVTQGQSVEFKTSLSRPGQAAGVPTGQIEFKYFPNNAPHTFGVVKLVNGSASLQAQTNGSIPPGNYEVVADYDGDAYDQNAGTAIYINVIAATSASLSVSPNPIPANHSVTLTATVKRTYSPGTVTGSVEFRAGGAVIASAELKGSGVATATTTDSGIPGGSYSVTANYAGDSTDASSTSAPVTVVVQ